MGTTIRLGQTSRLASVSLKKGSSHIFTALAPAPAKSRLKWISGGFLHQHSSSGQEAASCEQA